MVLGVFMGLAGALFLADLLAHRTSKPITLANAAIWTSVYIVGALAFAAFLYTHRGPDFASMFLAGFVMEKALSVDNLMVFVAIFSYFRIPPQYQHRILHYGIIGAVVFRLIFVAVGAGALQAWGAPVALLFGLIVLWSAFKMWTTVEGDEEPIDYAAQWYARWAVKVLPFANHHEGGFFIRKLLPFANGAAWITYGTPLLMCLIAIEISDVLFSFDSVPAVIAVTQDPVLVYSAMIFAILGLRMLYFVLSAALRYLTRLGGAVVLVLGFIGIKLVAEAAHRLLPLVGIHPPGHLVIGPVVSLLVVLGLLVGGVLASIIWPETEKAPANAPHAS